MVILYGGAFNPPTIAHLEIIKYLQEHFADAHILVMPTNNKYKDEKLVDYSHRLNMVRLLVNGLDNIEVSDFELKQNDKYLGTANTLAKLNHPYFVMGADALAKITSWINPEVLIKDNQFIVFPRDNISVKEIINNDELLKKYKNHFKIIDDFKEIDCSSTSFRELKDQNLLTSEVYEYIKDNNLYL